MTARQRRRGRRRRPRQRPEAGAEGGQTGGRTSGQAPGKAPGEASGPATGQESGQTRGQSPTPEAPKAPRRGRGGGSSKAPRRGRGRGAAQATRGERRPETSDAPKDGRRRGAAKAPRRGRVRPTAPASRGERRPEVSPEPPDQEPLDGRERAQSEQPRAQPKPKPPKLESIETIGQTLERVLETSPADETELVWLEVLRGEATRRGSRIDVRISPERTILVRVLDLGRVGSYRTCSGEVGDLSNAVRLAISQSRVREPLTGLPHLPADAQEAASHGELHDPAVSGLTPARARELLKALPAERETLRLEWADARVAVFNSRKLRRQAVVTGVGFEARCGRRPGSGRAADAARRLEDLNPESIIERARERHASGDVAEPPEPGAPVVLAPEAAISLIEMLNQESFSAKAYYDGTSFLREHLGIQVFDRALTLRDDGTDADGIPFPFDLEGTAKRAVPLILDGAPKTPALDQRQAAVLGLPPTAHAIGGNDARAQNVFLVAGDKSVGELLQAAEGGVWIGWLDHLECREPNRVQFRTRARGARLIENGELGRALPDLFWEDSLLRAFSSILGIGSETSRRLTRDGYFGGFSAPAIALGGVESLRAS